MHLIQLCHLLNLRMVGYHEHPLRFRFCFAKETWPETVHEDDPKGQKSEMFVASNEYFALYRQKMRLWGSWLISQWLNTYTLSLEDWQNMMLEQIAIRSHYSWSIPNDQALEVLASHAPLQLQQSYWASLLKERSVDISLSESELETSRSQVLFADETLNALEFLDRYQGKKLILIGEWKPISIEWAEWDEDLLKNKEISGISESSRKKSFSLDFQRRVEMDFELLDTLDLPTWPLSADRLLVFQR